MVTSLFGKKKFGTFKFGPTTRTAVRYGLEVDWGGKQWFDGTNEGSNLVGMTIERGRQYTVNSAGDAFEEEKTGNFSATLLDLDRRYDMFNESSALYGKLTGGKAFRVKVRTPGDAVYALMAGVLDEPVSFRDKKVLKARLQGVDGWSFLRDQANEVTVPLSQNVYVDDAMKLVLAKADWKAIWGYELDAGVDLRSYFWVDAKSAAKVIHELAHNELGNVQMRADGKLRFRSRVGQETEVLELTDTDCLDVRRMSPKDVIRNVLRVQSAPRSEQAEQTVWETPEGQRIEIAGGTTISDIWVDYSYNNENVPVKDIVSPVATTDYNATANSDGTGASLTGNISVALESFSTRGQISITNSGVSTAYVYCKVRGKPLAKTNSVTFQTRDQESIEQFGARPFTLTVDQNVNIARQYRELLGFYFTEAKNYLVVDLLPNPELQFKADLGDVIYCNLQNYGIAKSYRVIGIRHEFHDEAGIVMRTKWWLEPFSRLFAGVQIPMQIPFQLGGVA